MKNPTDPAPSVAAPPVHFGGATMTPIADLKPYARNNRAHSEKQIELLAKNIKALGWRWPIIVSKDSGIIVAGHGRWMAAKSLGLDSVPVVFQSFKTPQDEEAFRIADNKIPELADIQAEALRDVLDELSADGYDMDLTGFQVDAIEETIREVELKPLDVHQPPKMAWVLIGVPIAEWAKLGTLVATAAEIDRSIVETAANDQQGIRVCEECGTESGVNIHHIDMHHENNDPDNLMLLCSKCHTAWHWKNGKGSRGAHWV